MPDAVVGRRARSPTPTRWRGGAALIANGRAPGVHRRQRRLLGRGVGRSCAAAVEHLRVPCFFNGLGRGCLPADHELAFTRTRGLLKTEADLVVVVGTPLDFRLGFGRFGDGRGRPRRRRRRAAGRPRRGADRRRRPRARSWPRCADRTGAAGRPRAVDRSARDAETGPPPASVPRLAPTPIRSSPARIYGELGRRLDRDAVVICDGGDFAIYAGKYVEVYQPGCWLDTGPYGCLGNGPGYAIAARVARPSSQVVAAARRRRGRLLPDGRRLAGPPRAAGRDDRRQQRHLGPGEAPDAGHLRLGRRLRPAARLPLRRGGAAPSAAPARR